MLTTACCGALCVYANALPPAIHYKCLLTTVNGPLALSRPFPTLLKFVVFFFFHFSLYSTHIFNFCQSESVGVRITLGDEHFTAIVARESISKPNFCFIINLIFF